MSRLTISAAYRQLAVAIAHYDERRRRRLAVRAGSDSNFFRLWAGSIGSNLGDGIVRTALPLLAIRLTDSPALVAGVTVIATASAALLVLPAGVLADRLDRRRIMAGANTVRFVVLATVALSAVFHGTPLLAVYIVALALGACEVLADTTASALVPSLVSRDRLEWANSRVMGAEIVMNEFLGPPLGGALVTAGIALALGASSGSYLMAAVALLLLRGSFRPDRSTSTSLWPEISAGLRYLWRHRLLRTISFMVAVMAAGWSAWTAVLVLYVVRPGPVGLSSFGYGVLLAALAAGGLAGTTAAGWVMRRVGRRGVMAIDVAATITMLAVPAILANKWAIGAATFIGGLGSAMWNVVIVSLRQALTPDIYMGRVAAASRLVGWGMMPLGAALAGVVAELVGVRAVFAGAALLTAALVVPMLGSRPVRSLEDARPLRELQGA